jgi:hypothetical protein
MIQWYVSNPILWYCCNNGKWSICSKDTFERKNRTRNLMKIYLKISVIQHTVKAFIRRHTTRRSFEVNIYSTHGCHTHNTTDLSESWPGCIIGKTWRDCCYCGQGNFLDVWPLLSTATHSSWNGMLLRVTLDTFTASYRSHTLSLQTQPTEQNMAALFITSLLICTQ